VAAIAFVADIPKLSEIITGTMKLYHPLFSNSASRSTRGKTSSGGMLAVLWLATFPSQFVQAQCNLTTDTCGTQQNGICDAGFSCDANTDCVDCDPLVDSFFTCDSCIDAGGAFCWGGPNGEFGRGLDFCNSLEVAAAVPNKCIDDSGGSAYYTSCDTPVDLASQCNFQDTTCAFTSDGICDAAGSCAPDTDCVDCDALVSNSFSCDVCIEQGGVYCFGGPNGTFADLPGNSYCLSPEVAALVPNQCIDESGGSAFFEFCRTPSDDTSQCNLEDTSCPADRINNGLCDEGYSCAPYTDCADCDPLRSLSYSCNQCVAAGGLYCWGGPDGLFGGFGQNYCNSPALAEDFCQEESSGTPFYSACEPSRDFSQCDLQDTSCRYSFDFLCDAGRSCAPNSDCFDCDPMMLYRDSCALCIAKGGEFCTTGTNETVCSSPGIAAEFPTFCSDDGGTPYQTECPVIEETCDFENDPCDQQFDGICNAGVDCPANSDCYDCSECTQLRTLGCEGCTNAGCVWCGAEALCMPPGGGIPPPFNLDWSNIGLAYTCTDQDFVSTCEAPDSSLPFDPPPFFEANDWVYEMINIKPVWASGFMGTGINLRVNDDGVDALHPDLSHNFDLSQSCDKYLPTSSEDFHGTVCASLAAAGTGGECGVGVAPNATLSGCSIFSDENFANPTYLWEGQDTDVSSNSYGADGCADTGFRRKLREQRKLAGHEATCPFDPTFEGNVFGSPSSPCAPGGSCVNDDFHNGDLSLECEDGIVDYCGTYYERDYAACSQFLDLFAECSYGVTSLEEQAALAKGITEGRNGKGIVYIFSSGNYFDRGDDTNFQAIIPHRFTIAVGAVGKDGIVSSYSVGGASLFVTAPGGDTNHETDFVVAQAFTASDCRLAQEGTSYSTPIVAGVAILILEANPDLTWRDVQGVLAATSQKMEPDHVSWVTNAAGFHHSYRYGFGVVDAEAAVKRAQEWELWGPELQIMADSGMVNVSIPEFEEGEAETTMSIDTTETFVAESVSVYLDLQHSTRGHLDIVLVSPSGTESLLHPGPRPENESVGDGKFKLVTLRNWGESPKGEWTLRLVDKKEGDLVDCVDADWVETPDTYWYPCEPYDTDAATCDDPEFAAFSPNSGCCACGGGTLSSSVVDVLFSWRLQVFGRETTLETSTGPTDAPAQTPPTGTAGKDETDDDDDDDDDDDGADSAASISLVYHKCLFIAVVCLFSWIMI